jgi:ADP-heptose:LPS heptosyltransferase
VTKPSHVLVFRFSALGDVAMTVPVIKLLLQQHPNLQVIFVSNTFAQPLFEDIERLHFFVADLKGKHKGVTGLYRLHKEIQSQFSFDAIADLHNVLRTKMLRFFFSFSRKKIAAIDKGRAEKKELTRIKNKKLRPLKPTFQRYADVFTSLGLPVLLNIENGIKSFLPVPELIELKQQGFHIIGLAPFAKHAEKMYPLEKMKEVVRELNQANNIKLFLFGSMAEALLLKQWETEFSNVKSLAGNMNFGDEIKWIAELELMVSMDSANMHLASLFGVPVVSVWGATHPFAGFYGWGQKEENMVQVDLYCRPCSVFGNKPCYRGDWACMHSITPGMIVKRINNELEHSHPVLPTI